MSVDNDSQVESASTVEDSKSKRYFVTLERELKRLGTAYAKARGFGTFSNLVNHLLAQELKANSVNKDRLVVEAANAHETDKARERWLKTVQNCLLRIDPPPIGASKRVVSARSQKALSKHGDNFLALTTLYETACHTVLGMGNGKPIEPPYPLEEIKGELIKLVENPTYADQVFKTVFEKPEVKAPTVADMNVLSDFILFIQSMNQLWHIKEQTLQFAVPVEAPEEPEPPSVVEEFVTEASEDERLRPAYQPTSESSAKPVRPPALDQQKKNVTSNAFWQDGE
jgi:hypothetical protein